MQAELKLKTGTEDWHCVLVNNLVIMNINNLHIHSVPVRGDSC